MNHKLALLAASLALFSPFAPAADERQIIAVSPDVRAIVLEEMRTMLIGVQGIVDGLARDDMAAVATAAKPLGPQMMHQMPAAARQQLPMAFRERGHATHMAFSQLAMDAEGLGDTQQVLGQLASAMQNCIECHALFQLQSGVE